MEQPDAVQSQRNTAAEIAFELAEVMAQDGNSDEAVRYYKEALLHNDGLQKVCAGRREWSVKIRDSTVVLSM